MVVSVYFVSVQAAFLRDSYCRIEHANNAEKILRYRLVSCLVSLQSLSYLIKVSVLPWS